MKFEIKNRFTNETIIAVELPDEMAEAHYSERLGTAVKLAIKDGAILDGAILDGAILDGAILDGAILDGAILDGAILDGAILDGAILDGASLVGASLVGARLDRARLDRASLVGASLVGASLVGARLVGASLVGASLVGARLVGASLVGARLDRASLVGARLDGAILVGASLDRASLVGARLGNSTLKDLLPLIRVPSLNRRILAAIESGGKLRMSEWHTCETTHCRAGWAIHLAGMAGKVLEACVGPATAGTLIYFASVPRLERGPNFYASNEDALADIRRMAETEPELVST